MKYFGTDGIRLPATQFTSDFIMQIIAGLAAYAGTNKKVLIGGDTRESTEWILQDLATALETFGFDYASVGVLPTPAINYCFFKMGFDFAIDVTASHNPYTDNGIKIFERSQETDSGTKLSPAGCATIEAALASPQSYQPVSISDREDLHDEALALYLEHLRNYFSAIPGLTDLCGQNIAIDFANGATSAIGPEIFESLGATVTTLHLNPTYGQSINQNCGSTHPESLITAVTANHLDFGIAYDGDGDRTLLVDHTGTLVDGDDILAILADYLHLDSIAVTVMANQGLLNWAKQNHITTSITAVGDSNIATAMLEHHIHLGGEQSGHIILPGEPTGDGILTSLIIAKILQTTKQPLHTARNIITKLPQVSLTLPATPAQKQKIAQDATITSIIAHFTEKVNSECAGRVLVRPSGTEPLIRITVWGDDEAKITQLAHDLCTTLKEKII